MLVCHATTCRAITGDLEFAGLNRLKYVIKKYKEVSLAKKLQSFIYVDVCEEYNKYRYDNKNIVTNHL